MSNVSGRLAAVASLSNGSWQATLFSYDADGRVDRRLTYTHANLGHYGAHRAQHDEPVRPGSP